MKPRTARLLRLGLSVVIVAALIVFARKVNWHDTWQSIVKADWRLLALAALVNIASLVLKGVRWWVFLRPIGSPSLWLAIRATFVGAGLNNILVANGGEAARVVFVSQSARVPSAKVLATLALDRLFELVGYVTMLALSISFLSLPPSLTRTRPFAWAVLAAMVALMIYLVRRPKIISEPVAAGADSFRAKLANYFRHFGSAIGGISTGSRFAAAMILSVGGWALQVATYALTARAAHFDLPLVGTVAALLAVNIGFALRATPGNVGVFQGLYALTAAAFGLDKDQAIAVALLIQTQQIVPITLLGVAAAPEFIFKRHQTERADVDARRPRAGESANSPGAKPAP